MRTINDLHRLLKSRGLESLIPHVAESVAPSIRLVLEPYPLTNPWSGGYPNDETPLGCSKIGGLPDLPPDFSWPESEKYALPFLAQFRLEEVASHDLDSDLPHSGMLSFFYDLNPYYDDASDADSKELCQVFYFENDPNLTRRPFSGEHPAL